MPSLSSDLAALLSRDRQATVGTPSAHPEEAGRKAPISEDPALLCSTPHSWGHELAVPQFPHLRVTERPSPPPRVPGTLAFQVTGRAGLFLCRSSSTASSALHLGKHSAPSDFRLILPSSERASCTAKLRPSLPPLLPQSTQHISFPVAPCRSVTVIIQFMSQVLSSHCGLHCSVVSNSLQPHRGPPGFSVIGIFQATILEQVAISSH